MTVAEMIAQRTAKLTAIKDSSNAAVTAKGGTAADDLSGLPAAIESITSGGGALPVLTNPAEVGHVIAGKEYIDGAGMKRVGTLVVCDTIKGVESFGEVGVGLKVEIESTADSSTKILTLPEPNLLPENIKRGVSIFGIAGSAKTLRVETGTITPAADTISLELPCTADPKMYVVSAVDTEAVVSGTANAALTASGTSVAIKRGSADSPSESCMAMVTLFISSNAKIVQSSRIVLLSPIVTIESNNGYPWKAGMEYQWTAYYWEDT